MALNSKQGSAPNVPFVNTGKIRWKAVREEWRKGAPQKSAQVKKVEIDTDQLYDEIYEPEFHGKLSQPIPLPQLIDFLVDVWDSDGI